MANQFDNTVKRFQALPVTGKFLIAIGAFVFLILFAPSGKKLVGPLSMLLIWFVLSMENRTITFSTMLLACGVGLVGFIPAATILGTPIVLIFGKGTLATIMVQMLSEVLLIAGALAGLTLWPQSRLRYTASIVDFSMLGLCLGIGLESGISILYPEVAGFQGKALGMLPQLPGMLGQAGRDAACASPMAWGMLLGLLTGVARYLLGPDFGDSWMHRSIVIGIALLCIGWIAGERVGFCVADLKGIGRLLYWLDLKGRLLAYMTGLATMTMLLVEWLLIQERDKSGTLKRFWANFFKTWKSVEKGSVLARGAAVLHWEERRALRRELAFAAEVKSVLPPDDMKKMQQRISVITHQLDGEGS